jgi:hypothetical protein
LKSDEVLAPKDLGNGFYGIKPRLVKAVDPTIQAACCVPIDRAMKMLKTIWQEPFQFDNGWEVTFTVGSGKNGTELGTWFTEKYDWIMSRKKRAAIIIAGDDTFIMANGPNGLIFAEIDFSKYDRTQGVHALLYEMKILHLFGMDPETAASLYNAITATAVYEEHSLEYKAPIHMPIQRATGGPDTTFGNTFNTSTSIFGFFQYHDNIDFSLLPKFQSLFGFESKYKESSSFQGMTFLKGSWFPHGHRYIWLPLPSQAIKIGKILTNPLDIYKKSSTPEAWRKAAYSLAKGLGNIPFDYPILGDLVQYYLTIGIENDVLIKESVLKPEITENLLDPLDLEFIYQFLADRYGITLDEVLLLKLQISQLQQVLPPVLLPSNSLWPKLWADYE